VERLLTAQEVAELLSVPASWVYAEARAGRIPHVRVGRYRRFSREAIEQWARALERGPQRRPTQ
jgi:excisionase family DNA binding protein